MRTAALKEKKKNQGYFPHRKIDLAIIVKMELKWLDQNGFHSFIECVLWMQNVLNPVSFLISTWQISQRRECFYYSDFLESLKAIFTTFNNRQVPDKK